MWPWTDHLGQSREEGGLGKWAGRETPGRGPRAGKRWREERVTGAEAAKHAAVANTGDRCRGHCGGTA